MQMANDHTAPATTSLDVKKAAPWIMYLIFFGVLNETVFGVSTPGIAAEYQLTEAGVTWMMTMFMLFFGIGSAIYGKLADLFSLRKLIVIGIAIYCFGSLLGLAGQASFAVVLVARAIQGAGASAIPALIMVVVARYIVPEQRGKVFGILNSTVALAIGFGPVIGGFVSAHLHWSLLFVISLFTLGALPYFYRNLPDEAFAKGKVDIRGAIWLSLGVAFLMLFFTYWNEAMFVLSLAAGLVAVGLFIWHIRRVNDPFIQPVLFRNARFRIGLIVGGLVFCVEMGLMFVMPFFLGQSKGLSPDLIGWTMFPGALVAVVMGPWCGALADRRGNYFVVMTGLTVFIVTLVLFSILLGAPVWVIALLLVLQNIGFTFVQTALANSVSMSLELSQTGVGMGLFNLIGCLIGSMGMTITGSLLHVSFLRQPLLPISVGEANVLYSNLFMLLLVFPVIGAYLYGRYFAGKTAKIDAGQTGAGDTPNQAEGQASAMDSRGMVD